MREQQAAIDMWPSWSQCHQHIAWSTVDTCSVRTCVSDRDDWSRHDYIEQHIHVTSILYTAPLLKYTLQNCMTGWLTLQTIISGFQVQAPIHSIAYWTFATRRSYVLVGWVSGQVGDLWPNGERYGVGLNGCHIRKRLWDFDWHHQIWPWMILRGQTLTSKSFDSKYLENSDRYEVGPPGALMHRTMGFRLTPSIWPWMTLRGQKQGHTFLREIKTASYDVGPNGDYIQCPWASLWMNLWGNVQGHNPLIQNILKMVTDTRLDPREDFYESSQGLSIGTVRFDLGRPWGIKNQSRSFGCEICGER